MTSKVIKIIIGDRIVLVDRKDMRGVDLSKLRIAHNGYVMVGSDLLHRLILKPSVGMQIDHRNRNPLDNRRSNLRICTPSQNQMNRPKTKRNTSGFKGVTLDGRRKRKKFQARISVDKKTYHLGGFEKADAAASSYKKAAERLHGKFARTDA